MLTFFYLHLSNVKDVAKMSDKDRNNSNMQEVKGEKEVQEESDQTYIFVDEFLEEIVKTFNIHI
jgi:hypothetical protein